MSSNIVFKAKLSPRTAGEGKPVTPLPLARQTATSDLGRGHFILSDKRLFLVGLGERVRALRSRRGMTRKALAAAAQVSERHLANLECGVGNASILVLLQISQALNCSLAELLGDLTTQSPEWLMIRDLLGACDEAALRRAHESLRDFFGQGPMRAREGGPHSSRIALIGLRGAGKSTLGQMLASDLGFPFVEISREIERLAGCTVHEIQSLYGQNAYRRYERRAVEAAVQTHPQSVMAMPGGLVSDPTTFNRVLAHCTTVWLQASPEDHMKRVLAQGDLRPMAGNREAMRDLKSILSDRAAFYSKSNVALDTSAAPLESTFLQLRRLMRMALKLPSE